MTTRSYSSNEPITLMKGGVINISPQLLPDTTYTLSYLRGDSTFESSYIDNVTCFVSCNSPNISAGVVGGSVNQVDNRYTRNDIEALAQTCFTNPDLSNFSWIAGFRAELSDIAQDVAGISPSPANPYSYTRYTQHVDYNFYSVKGGFGYALPISASGNHELFGNFLGVFGVNNVSASGVPVSNTMSGSLVFGHTTYDSFRIGNDFAVGYQYRWSDRLTFDVRYRALISYIFATPTTQIFGSQRDKFYVQQGPMAELTWKF
jgi:hypothetical protein